MLAATAAVATKTSEPQADARRERRAVQKPVEPLHRVFGNRAIARAVAGGLSSPGAPLDGRTGREMRTRFGGFDFHSVRLHADGPAAASARSLDSVAYTIGTDIVLDSTRVASDSRAGRRVLAHELTHVAQQAHAVGDVIDETNDALEQEAHAFAFGERTGAIRGATPRPMIQRVGAWEWLSRFFGGGTFTDPELQAYLTSLTTTHHAEGNFDSDNKAREVVRRWLAGQAGYTALTAEQKMLMIDDMIEGYTGDDDEIAILAILTGTTDADNAVILPHVGIGVLRDNIHWAERDMLEEFLRLYQQRAGALVPRDLFAGTRALTTTERTRAESLLVPGSTIVGGVLVHAPLMTGLPVPPAIDGAFATDMKAALSTYATTSAADFRALRAAGPVLPVSRTNNIAVAAQTVTESHFAPYTQAASRAPADPYHPGTYALSSIIEDQSAVPITDSGSGPYPGRIGWTGYWMTQDFTGGEAVMNTYDCDTTREPDATEFARVRDSFATDAANQTDIDDTIHGWPAEAAGGVVKIQPYSAATSPTDIRKMRWDLFTTLIHELMHVLEHPNSKRAAAIIGGRGQETLKEGFADVMRHDLWDGPGNLQGRLTTSAYEPVRLNVEGGHYPYDSSVIVYHTDYGNPYVRANDIVHGSGGVGIANAKAAFFLGHTELLGIGPGTSTTGGVPLTGVAFYSPTDVADAQILVVSAGDTFASIRSRTNAGVAGVFAPDGSQVTDATALSPGMRLRVPGIRWVYAMTNDTASSIAGQHEVSLAALKTANGLPPATPGTYVFPAGTRVLIPIH